MDAAAAEAGGSEQKKQRFVVKKWNAVAVWSWSICTDTCAICRNSLHEPSIEYQANPGSSSEDGLSISWGACGHVFHHDCISKWLRARSNCPLCNKEWEFAKIEKVRGPLPARTDFLSTYTNSGSAHRAPEAPLFRGSDIWTPAIPQILLPAMAGGGE